MTELERLASRLPVKRFSRREMFLYAIKMRVRSVWEINLPVVYRYWKKTINYLGIHL